MPKVYLSSTLLDLKEERQAVTDWLIAAGYQPVHSYVADSETVRDSCLEDIAGCDFYVLIVGHRYGFQPAKRNPKKRSITELEFQKAGKLRIPRLAFLRTSVPDTNLSDINDPDRLPKVLALREEVSEALRAAEFKDMTEFVAAFSAAIQQNILKLLRERDAQAQDQAQRIERLEQERDQARSAAVGKVLDAAAQPNAGDLAMHARQALLKGDTAQAEELLRKQEGLAAEASKMKSNEAADLARQIAALAIDRDSRIALDALERAAHYQPEDFWTQIQLGDAQSVLGQSSVALTSYNKAQDIAKALAALDPANSEWQRDLSVSHERIGDVLVSHGKGHEGLDAYRKSLGIRAALNDHEPAITEWQRDLSVSHDKIGDVLRAQGDGAAALVAYRKGLAIRETLAARDPANTEWQRDLSVSHEKIGDVLVAQGDGAAALAAYRKRLAIAETLAAGDPANTQWQRDLSVSHDRIGDVLVAQGDGTAALAAYRKGLAIAETLAARDPANAEWRRDLIVSHVKLGEASGDVAYTRRALEIAQAMRDKGTLAPRDAWMIEELERRVREGTP